MTSYCGCPRNCQSFREHVGNGPYVPADSMPTRGNEVQRNTATEKRWTKENDAFTRLAKAGHVLPRLDGADKIEKNARTEIELKHGKIYGKNAEKMQAMVDGAHA